MRLSQHARSQDEVFNSVGNGEEEGGVEGGRVVAADTDDGG